MRLVTCMERVDPYLWGSRPSASNSRATESSVAAAMFKKEIVRVASATTAAVIGSRAPDHALRQCLLVVMGDSTKIQAWL